MSGNRAGSRPAAGATSAGCWFTCRLPVLVTRKGTGPAALCRPGGHGALELRLPQGYAEDGAAWLEDATRPQAVQPDCVIAHALDEAGDDIERRRVVAGDSERPPVGRASRPPFVVKLVVANVVQGLDDRRAG